MYNCLIHTRQVLDFYQPFSETFSRNLVLSFDLSKRVAFSKASASQLYQIHNNTLYEKVSDKKLDKVFDKLKRLEAPFSPKKSDVLKKVVVKFKSKVRRCPYPKCFPVLSADSTIKLFLARRREDTTAYTILIHFEHHRRRKS